MNTTTAQPATSPPAPPPDVAPEAPPPSSPPPKGSPPPPAACDLEEAEAEASAAALDLRTARAALERVAGPPRSTGKLAEERAEAVRLAEQRLADARHLVERLHRRAAGLRVDLEETELAAASHDADATAATARAEASRAHAAELRARLVEIMGDRPLPVRSPDAAEGG